MDYNNLIACIYYDTNVIEILDPQEPDIRVIIDLLGLENIHYDRNYLFKLARGILKFAKVPHVPSPLMGMKYNNTYIDEL